MAPRVVLPLASAVLCLVLCLSFLLSSTSAVPCGGSGYDLSSITFSDLVYVDYVKNYTYYFHPCGNVTYSGCQNLDNLVAGGTMLCQLPFTGGNGYSIATWVPESTQALTTWTPYGGGGNNGNRGLQMFLQDGQVCSSARALTVNFRCNNSLPAGIATMTSFNETTTCNYVATVQTSATCTGPNSTVNGQVACGTTGLDLSSLTTTDLIWKDTVNNYTYYFRPCGVVTSAQCANNPYGQVAGESMMCQSSGVYGELSPNTYDIAYWNPQLASWRVYNYQGQVTGWEMKIQDGTSCNNGISRALTVLWVCLPSATTPIFLYLNETSECNYVAYIQTVQACNQASIVTSVVSCGGPYDLSFTSARDLVYQVPSSTQYIVFRPCGIVDNAVCQAQPNTNRSMVCQAYQGSTGTNDVAIYNPALTTYTPTLTGIQMYIQDGDVCGTLGPRSLTVNFVCQQNLGAQVVNFVNFQETSTCQYVATLNTNAVCRTGRPSTGLCGSANYDFSLIGGSEYAFTTSNAQYTFYFQPCGQVLNAQCNANNATSSSMMCQAVVGSSSTYDIAFYDSQLVSWYRLANGGWQMFVQDGTSCGGNGYQRALTVNFLCGTSAIMTNVTEVSTCNYVAFVYTPQACQPVANGGATGLNLNAQSSSGTNGAPPAYETVSRCGGLYNLLPLATTDLTYSDPNYNWVFRPCGAVSSNSNCTSAAASTQGGWMLCQDSRTGTGDYEGSSYNQYTVTWTPLGMQQGGGVLMTQSDGAICAPTGVPRVTRAFFQCSAAATTAVLYNVTESPTCTYNLYIRTSLACPSAATTCGGAGYNLTSLTARADLTYAGSGYNYYFAPCGTVQASACQANLNTQSAMICQASTTSNSTYNLAVYAPQAITWSAYPNGGVQMTVQDGSTCDNYDFLRVFTAVFLCGSGGPTGLINVTEITLCNYLAFVNTGQSCAALSGGGVTQPTAAPSGTPVVTVTSSSRVGRSSSSGGASSIVVPPTTGGGGGGSSGLSGGAIAGIVIGSIVGALILLGLVLVACCGVGGFGRKKTTDPDQPRTTGRYGEMGAETEASQSNVEMETTHHGETAPEVSSE